MNLREMTKEQLAEESLIDLAYAILEERKSPLLFADLLKAIQAFNGQTEEELKAHLVQFYTDLNIDGRFLLNHENGWGLRTWYKIETIEEETAPTVKVRKKKSKLAEDEEEELEDLDEEDIGFEEDFDEFVEEEEEIEEELIDFDDEEIEDIDADIDEDLIEEDDEFLIDEEEELEEEEEEIEE
ncbi:DNA-directed RNA polymerase subunit delta [Bacillus ndiopicus]|uniref:DNA-directed RNA polymerase subunit delta n=1 Tax=Bacillus ndiopicus TaxID=1347368 RepID=UPI000AAE56A7|nr:DNA-directed RNA polymerase subunit delta [Bacillus ndiopicus]